MRIRDRQCFKLCFAVGQDEVMPCEKMSLAAPPIVVAGGASEIDGFNVETARKHLGAERCGRSRLFCSEFHTLFVHSSALLCSPCACLLRRSRVSRTKRKVVAIS